MYVCMSLWLLRQLKYAARNKADSVNQLQGRRVGQQNLPPAERQQNYNNHWRQNPVI